MKRERFLKKKEDGNTFVYVNLSHVDEMVYYPIDNTTKIHVADVGTYYFPGSPYEIEIVEI